MRTALHLVRLMAYTSLARTTRLGPEDRIAGEFATRLRVATVEGRLRAVWCHVPNEMLGGAGKPTRMSSIARALGTIPGAGDYLFQWGYAHDVGLEPGNAVLECKTATGRMADNQKDMQQWCADMGVPYHVFRSAHEGCAILRGLGVLL